MKTKAIRKLFEKWTYRLGLRWWNVKILYYDDAEEIQKQFGGDDNNTVVTRTYSDWRYATTTIHVNFPALKNMDKHEIENTIVHELCHALVNEMREKELHHEERVVTGLAKAFLWTESATVENHD